MKKIIYKTRIQCPNCEGCGKMARHCTDKEGKHGIESFVCKVCNGKGLIEGDIKIEFDDLN